MLYLGCRRQRPCIRRCDNSLLRLWGSATFAFDKENELMRTSWLQILGCLLSMYGLSSYGLTSSAEAQEAAGSCLTFSAGQPDESFCSPECPCAVGQGGCDGDSDCLSGYCSPLAGARFALPADFGVCTAARCLPISPAAPDGSACTPQCPCPEGWGDCDNDTDCQPGLFCGQDYGYLADLPATYDICLSSCPVFDLELPGGSFCSAQCPCSQGHGDCDSDDQCKPGTVCRHDVGKWVKLDPTWDVCEPPFNPSTPDPSYCTKWGCGEGEGDCDADSECKPGLYCAHGIGASYGLPASYGVCTSQRWTLTARTSSDGAAGSVLLPSGATCTGNCTYQVNKNTELALTVTMPSTSLVKWSGCTRVSGTTCFVQMSSNQSVSAFFVSKNCPRFEPYCCKRAPNGACDLCALNRFECMGGPRL